MYSSGCMDPVLPSLSDPARLEGPSAQGGAKKCACMLWLVPGECGEGGMEGGAEGSGLKRADLARPLGVPPPPGGSAPCSSSSSPSPLALILMRSMPGCTRDERRAVEGLVARAPGARSCVGGRKAVSRMSAVTIP